MEKVIEKAGVLMEALPYIREYRGKIVVIKFGGNAMQDEKQTESVLMDIVLMKFVGMNPIIVHGGGPQINEVMHAMGLKPRFVDGLRVTDKATMEVVKMVLVGKINKEIVSIINKNGASSIGISGEDGQLLLSEKLESAVDIGFVGTVKKVKSSIILDLIGDGFIPVIATVGVDTRGNAYNVNADLAAGEIASSVNAAKLIFLTDVDGLFSDYPSNKKLISKLKLSEGERLVSRKLISEGMLPKISGALSALKQGVEKVHLLNGTTPHALLLEIFTDQGIGTMLVK